MKDSVSLLYAYIAMSSGVITFIAAEIPQFSAVSMSLQVKEFYREIKSELSPDLKDPAASIPKLRQRICLDIANSGFFGQMQFVPIDVRKVYDDWNRPRYVDIFFAIYRATDSGNFYEYSNPYNRRTFKVTNFDQPVQEYAFACPLKDLTSNSTILFYISKEYGVGPFERRRSKPGRFVFGNLRPTLANNAFSLMLAEEPAAMYQHTRFNVEIHYLHTRKHAQPVSSNDLDPLCKNISREINDPNNPHNRLCVAISASSSFEDMVRYPQPTVHPCVEEKISFKTAEGIKEAAEQEFYEWMTMCESVYINPYKGQSFLYVSRAYTSNQVLVYMRDPSDGNLYLHNLSVRVAITDEVNSFDFVE